MKSANWKKIAVLSILIILLNIIISLVGLLSTKDPETIEFTSISGEMVLIYGKGIYKYESIFKSPILRGYDLIIVLFAVPALIYSTWNLKKYRIKDRVIHAGILNFFLYNSASMAFGAAFKYLSALFV